MKPFWVQSITLDEDVNVTAIEAVIDAPYLEPIRAIVGPEEVPVLKSARGDTELWIRLTTRQLLDLFHWLGKRAPIDHRGTPWENVHYDFYDRLGHVIYGMMDD